MIIVTRGGLRARGRLEKMSASSASAPPGVPTLSFATPRRARPPLHLADLDAAERREAVAELGLPAYRADQLSRHYFSRLSDDPSAMTDLPKQVRDTLVPSLLPLLLSEVT